MSLVQGRVKVPYDFSFSSHFYIQGNLVQGHLEVPYYLRLSLSLFKCRIILSLRCFSTLGCLAQGQSLERREVKLLLFAGLPLVSSEVRNSCLYVFSLIPGVEVGEAVDNINCLLIWISMINSTPSILLLFLVFDFLSFFTQNGSLPWFGLLLIFCSHDMTSVKLS